MPASGPGYTALHESVAWLDLSGRGKIRAAGRDRVRFFHNMLSNDVRGVKPGQGNYNFLLSPKGRIQADANLFVFPDYFLLDCEPELAERINGHLKRYIIADQVQLENITAELATLALEGPRADEAAGIAVPAEAGAHIETDGVIVARASSTGQPGLWFFVDAARKGELIARWEQAGAVAATVEEARVVRVENRLPRCGEDFGDTTLPQETQQARALCFTKGCYLGQEIVERIRTRGQVHKLLVKVGIEGAEPPAAGSPVLAGQQEIGRLTSPVYSPRLGRSLGLAILRREFAAPESVVTVAGRPGRVLPGQ